jgi:hypothetical protein
MNSNRRGGRGGRPDDHDHARDVPPGLTAKTMIAASCLKCRRVIVFEGGRWSFPSALQNAWLRAELAKLGQSTPRASWQLRGLPHDANCDMAERRRRVRRLSRMDPKPYR